MSKLNKIIKNNLRENDTHPYYSYFNSKYNYNKNGNKYKESEETKEEEKNETVEALVKDEKTETKDIKEEIAQYKEERAELERTFSPRLEKLENELKEAKSMKVETEKDEEEKYEKVKIAKKKIIDLKRFIARKYSEIERSLKRRSPEAYKKIKHMLYRALLTEEEHLIFGDSLEISNDILLMENQETLLARIRLVTEKLQKARKLKDLKAVQEYNLQLSKLKELLAEYEKKERESQTKDALTGEKVLTEADNVSPTIRSAVKAIEKKNKDKEKLKQNKAIIDTKIEKIDQDIQKLQIKLSNRKQKEKAADQSQQNNQNNLTEEIVSTSADGEEVMETEDIEELSESSRISPDLRYENKIYNDKLKENRVSKNTSEDNLVYKNNTITKYDTMLFNGDSGSILKYIINNEINNTNKTYIEVAKRIEEDKEGAVVIKKIKATLKKALKKELTHEEYIDLKVQKSNFKQIFNRVSKEYENRYKN